MHNIQSTKIINWGDGFTVKRCVLQKHCNLHELVCFKIMRGGSTDKNPCICPDPDYSSFGDQYEQLLRFIKASNKLFQAQLESLIYPTFVHLYLELIINEAEVEAKKFFDNYSALFLKYAQSYREILNKLSAVTSLDDLSSYPDMKLFRKRRFVVQISEDCLVHLLYGLKDLNLKILLYLLSLYFSFECDESDTCSVACKPSVEHTFEEQHASEKRVAASSCSVKEPVEACAITALEYAIETVKKTPVSLPPIGMYNINTGSYRFSNVGISLNHSYLAAGFEESMIYLWNIPPNMLSTFGHKMLSVDVQEKNSILVGHSGPVNGLCFTPKEDYLFSCSSDNTVRSWNIKKQESVAVYSGHDYPVLDIDISRNCAYFTTCSTDGTVRIWTPERLNPLRLLVGHSLDASCVKFHPNCNYIASGSNDKTVRLWNVQSGQNVRVLVGHEAGITCLAFSPDGSLLASAGEDQKIKIFDLSTGALLKDLCGHKDQIQSICFASDGRSLISCGCRNSIGLWDLLGFQQTKLFEKKSEISVPRKYIRTYSSPRLVSCDSRNSVLAAGII